MNGPCVGKVFRWWRLGTFPRQLVVEYVILHEQGDRMLVYNMKWHSLQWITHVRPLLENYSDFLELADL